MTKLETTNCLGLIFMLQNLRKPGEKATGHSFFYFPRWLGDESRNRRVAASKQKVGL